MSKVLEVGQYVRVKQLAPYDQYESIYVTQHMANLSGTIQKITHFIASHTGIATDGRISLTNGRGFNWSKEMFTLIEDYTDLQEFDVIECLDNDNDSRWFTIEKEYTVLENDYGQLCIYDDEGDHWELEDAFRGDYTFKFKEVSEKNVTNSIQLLEAKINYNNNKLGIQKQELETIKSVINDLEDEISKDSVKLEQLKQDKAAKLTTGHLEVGDKFNMYRGHNEAKYMVIGMPSGDFGIYNLRSRKVLDMTAETYEDVKKYFTELYQDDEIKIIKQ